MTYRLAIVGLTLGTAFWSNAQPSYIPKDEMVKCAPLLKELGEHQNAASVDAMCYAKQGHLVCPPGLELQVDARTEYDLCVNGSGTPVTSPRCKAPKRLFYYQEITQRRFEEVEYRKTKENSWVHIPFSQRKLPAKLVGEKPLIRRKFDLCLFRVLPEMFQLNRIDFSRQNGPQKRFPTQPNPNR